VRKWFPKFAFECNLYRYTVVKGELENARFVWKRAPDTRRAGDEELQTVFGLLQSMWTRDYPVRREGIDSALTGASYLYMRQILNSSKYLHPSSPPLLHFVLLRRLDNFSTPTRKLFIYPALYFPAVHHAAGGAGAAWSAKLAPVVQHLATTFRADTLALLTKAGAGC
jgi:hypothetical protein